LTFAGTAPGPVVNVELQNVRFETPQKHEMTGTFEQLYSATGRSGMYRVFARLREMRSFD